MSQKQVRGTPRKAYIWAFLFGLCVSINLLSGALSELSSEWTIPYVDTDSAQQMELRHTAVLLQVAHVVFNHNSLYLLVPFIAAGLIVYFDLAEKKESSKLVGCMKQYTILWLVLFVPFLSFAQSPEALIATLSDLQRWGFILMPLSAIILGLRHPYRFKSEPKSDEIVAPTGARTDPNKEKDEGTVGIAAIEDSIAAEDGQIIEFPKKETIDFHD